MTGLHVVKQTSIRSLTKTLKPKRRKEIILGSLENYPDSVWTWVRKVQKRPIFADPALPVFPVATKIKETEQTE